MRKLPAALWHVSVAPGGAAQRTRNAQNGAGPAGSSEVITSIKPAWCWRGRRQCVQMLARYASRIVKESGGALRHAGV